MPLQLVKDGKVIATLAEVGDLPAVTVAPPPAVQPDPPPVEPPPPAVSPAAAPVTITIAGKSFPVDPAKGAELSPYAGQRNIVIPAAVNGSPLTVFYRPDADGLREEWIFELGTIQNQQDDLGAYTVQIGAETISVPKHYRFARWRWQSAPRSVIAKPTDLIAKGFLPPYDASQTDKAPRKTATSYTPMGLAGVTAYQPTTGERDDIGPLTEPQAEYICTGNPLALQTLLAQAEAAATFPTHFRDEKTWALISYDDYPSAGCFWDQHAAGDDPWFARSAQAGKDQVVPDGAHMPTLAYLPYLLTGDLYHLEELQAQVAFNWGNWPVGFRQKDKCICRYDQDREYAWDLRLVFQAASATPADAPSWLLSKSYFEAKLENNRVWFEAEFVNSTDPQKQTFRWATVLNKAYNGQGTISPWEEDFLAAELFLGIRLGYAAWDKAARWKVASSIARTDGKSGWPRSQACTYYDTVGTATTWADLAALNNVTGGNDVLDAGQTVAYLCYRRAVLALASDYGITEAQEPYQWLAAQRKSWAFKWAMK